MAQMIKIKKTTRYVTFALLSWTICACTSTPPSGGADSEIDSCAIAPKHPAAVALTLAGYNGTLNNYFGDDSTKLDFQHVYENGQVVESRFFYENGQLQEACTFKCQAMHGPRKLYFENGELEQRIPFRYGRRNGLGEKFDSTGRLIQRVHFHNDSLIGQVENF
jgi:MORN repeat variant